MDNINYLDFCTCCLCVLTVNTYFSVSSDLMMGSPSTVGVVIACTLACLRLISLTVYVAVATGHRYHLFVWSVFSPKLMYEIFSTAVHLGLLLVIMFLC